jgi:hypothetical protein
MKFVRYGPLGTYVNNTVFVFNFIRHFFIPEITDQTSQLIIMFDGSNDAVWCKKVPFWGLIAG